MRLATLVFLSAFMAQARISVTGDIEGRFAASDLVCRGTVSAITALSREGATDATGKLTPVDYDISFSDASCYKGTVKSQRFVVRIRRHDQSQGRPGAVRTRELLFLKTSEGSVLEPVEDGRSAILFWDLPRPSPGTRSGIPQLQRDIASVALDRRDLSRSKEALQLFLSFGHLDPDVRATLAQLQGSGDADTRLLCLEARLKTAGAGDHHALLRELAVALSARGGENPPGMFEILDVIAQKSSFWDFEALKMLVRCPYPLLRSSAMDAIRSLRAPRTMPFLVEQLDSNDPDVQYDALITLAEITNKGGDFGPTMDTFEKQPEKHIALWKKWWQDEGARRYAAPAR